MTVGIDVVTENIRTGTTSPHTFSHAGASSGVKGVLLMLCRNASSSGPTGVSYGGVALDQTGANFKVGGEVGFVAMYFLGKNVPQGTQTVSYDFGTTTDDVMAVCVTLTGTNDIQYVGGNYYSSDSVANPSLNLTNTSGRESLAFGIFFSGLSTVGSITLGSGQTALHDHDFGQQVCVMSRQTTASTGNFQFSYTSSADDVILVASAFSDVYISQETWRLRADDGSESAATWLAAAAADATVTVSSDQIVRVRFALKASGGGFLNAMPYLGVNIRQVSKAWDVTQTDTQLTTVYLSCPFSALGVALSSDQKLTFTSDNNSSKVAVINVSSGDYVGSDASGYLSSASFSYSSQSSSMPLVKFNAGGTKMYLVNSSDTIFQYSLSTAWDVTTATYDSVSLSPSQTTTARGFVFKGDGTKLYVCDQSNDYIYQYSLSTAWNISTASYDSISLALSGYGNVVDLAFSPNGLKLYVLDSTSYSINEHVLSTAWDISSASGTRTNYHTLGNTNPTGFVFVSDGCEVVTMNGSVVRVHPIGDSRWTTAAGRTTIIVPENSSYLTGGGDTTQQLVAGGTFVSPNAGVSEDGIAGSTSVMDFTAADQKCEVEYVFKLIASDLSDGDKVWLRSQSGSWIRQEV